MLQDTTERELFLLIQWHSTWTPSKSSLEGFRWMRKLDVWPLWDENWSIGIYNRQAGFWERASSMWTRVSICTSTWWWWWWMGWPQVNESDIVHLSIPLCHNESLCTDGNKTLSLIPTNTSHGQTESKIRKATNDLSRNFTSHLRHTFANRHDIMHKIRIQLTWMFLIGAQILLK